MMITPERRRELADALHPVLARPHVTGAEIRTVLAAVGATSAEAYASLMELISTGRVARIAATAAERPAPAVPNAYAIDGELGPFFVGRKFDAAVGYFNRFTTRDDHGLTYLFEGPGAYERAVAFVELIRAD